MADEQPPHRGETPVAGHGREARDQEASEGAPYRICTAEHVDESRRGGQRVRPGGEEEDGKAEGVISEMTPMQTFWLGSELAVR